MRRAFLLAAVAVTWLTGASPASAQLSDQIVAMAKRAGVGATVGVVAPLDSDVEVGTLFGVQFGLAPKAGWGLSAGLGWFNADLYLEDADVATVHIRPLLAGVAYTWIWGRISTSAALTAGLSFNSAEVDDEYRARFGPGTDLDLDMQNSFCLRPSVKVEYAVTPKFALTGWAGFFFTRIDSTLDTPIGRFEDQWDPSSFIVSVGGVVYPFR